MSSPISFQIVLQEQIQYNDNVWTYKVPNLPDAERTNCLGLVKSISVISSTREEKILLKLDKIPSNRVTRSEPLDKFILLSFAGFRVNHRSATPQESFQPGTAKQSAEYISRMLKTGVVLNGKNYHFFGHSNSQLKSRSCFMFEGSKSEVSIKIESMGDFSKLKSVGKKAKRIGLLFSSAEAGVTLHPDVCEDIDDIQYNGHIFTDGCGLIAMSLAQKLVREKNITYRNTRYLPSIYQIRYRGYKGVLTIEPSLKGKTLVQFRASMQKFKDAKDFTLSVVDYSKPYAFGYLNDEMIILLHSLGISTPSLLRKQSEHLQLLEDVYQGNRRAAFRFLSFCNRLDLAERLIMDDSPSLLQLIRRLVKEEYAKMLNKRDEQRCRILIPKSRLLFGVCDPSSKSGRGGLLKEGECFVRITEDGDGRPKTIINTQVLVTRNPCLHPGDLQKFKVKNVPEFSHLCDCIVFPTTGKRPGADLLSGGDLDGDKFFVSWDPEIIPTIMSQPAEYPGVKEPTSLKPVTDDDRADYFAGYTNASLGRVKNLYLKWARLKGPLSEECQQLNRLFSQCVDGNRIKIPNKLEDPPENENPQEPFILDELHDSSRKLIDAAMSRSAGTWEYPVEIMDLLLNRDEVAVSEFELLQLALRWCNTNNLQIKEILPYINFSALTDEQQVWFLSKLPPTKDTPSLIRNGLLQSHLVQPEELQHFSLDHPRLHWKPVFNSATDRMGRFLSTACRTLELFHKKLIILRPDERLTIAIYIPRKIERASEVQVNNSVRVFALPRSQGPKSPTYRVVPSKVNYRLYCDESTFQLYQLKRANTWIFLTQDALFDASPSNAGRRRHKQSDEDSIHYDCWASIALDKISKGIQTHVGKINRSGILGAEIYVISNRDVDSMHVLDQWLDYVDTEKVLPLFEPDVREYDAPSFKEIQWSDFSPTINEVVRHRDMSKVRNFSSSEEIMQTLGLLERLQEKLLLRRVFIVLLEEVEKDNVPVPRRILLAKLIEFLPKAAFLISDLLRSGIWIEEKDDMMENLVALAPRLVADLILSVNSIQSLVRDPLMDLLKAIKSMSFHFLADMIELVSLTVARPEIALDMLLECIEPEGIRLLESPPLSSEHFLKFIIGIAVEHIDEVGGSQKPAEGFLRLKPHGLNGGFDVVLADIRIDSPVSSTLRIRDHVRLIATASPRNRPFTTPCSMDAIVLSTDPGSPTFRCLHKVPTYLTECSWKIVHLGSFVTTKTMIDAVTKFHTERSICCQLYSLILGHPHSQEKEPNTAELPFASDPSLNQGQNKAVEAAMKNPLTFLWGPPGTGKTHTIVAILKQLLKAAPKSRLLVTAPTHNAVDNILRRVAVHISDIGAKAVRVTTSLLKVSADLVRFSVDAMVGVDLSTNQGARDKAQKRIKESQLVFTTCVGAGLGLLRDEMFEVVIVDEASQQTEPETLIPLVKGCKRAVIVGDHVQLRATVHMHGTAMGLDISLFERHYNLDSRPGIAKVMLETQYRMHEDICRFSSVEFYNGKLRTGVKAEDRVLPPSQFPWPSSARKIFIQCSSQEELGSESKSNRGQVELCSQVYKLLVSSSNHETSAARTKASTHHPLHIAILTPYTRQSDLLKAAIPSCDISSIDGFQGREADVVIFVTVRSNAHNQTGFLKDLRRLNVAMTRAKCGVVIIGDRRTLTNPGTLGERSDDQSKPTWKRLLDGCAEITLSK